MKHLLFLLTVVTVSLASYSVQSVNEENMDFDNVSKDLLETKKVFCDTLKIAIDTTIYTVKGN